MMQAGAVQTQSLQKIKVLIVDDSVTICRFLEATFNEEPDCEVVGYALDPFEARDKINKLQPDVITLDVEMPKMDGVTFLRNLMRTHPIPVVMFSSLTNSGTTATLDSLEAGAIDFMPKHSARSGEKIEDYIKELVRKVKAAAEVQLSAPQAIQHTTPIPELETLKNKLAQGVRLNTDIKRLIAIGSSTGGPEALRKILSQLDAKDCVFAIAQHMPRIFIESFAKRMNEQSAFTVSVAEDGQPLLPGHGYIAPGGRHLTLDNRNDGPHWKVLDSMKISGHKPSVNVLFKSMAMHAPKQSIGVLLTGMGEDGAEGLKAMRDSGCTTLIQNEASSVVWGMPGKAHRLEAQDETLHLDQIAPALNRLLLDLG